MGWQNRCEVDRRDLGPGWGGKSVVRWIAVIRATVGWLVMLPLKFQTCLQELVVEEPQPSQLEG